MRLSEAGRPGQAARPRGLRGRSSFMFERGRLLAVRLRNPEEGSRRSSRSGPRPRSAARFAQFAPVPPDRGRASWTPGPDQASHGDRRPSAHMAPAWAPLHRRLGPCHVADRRRRDQPRHPGRRRRLEPSAAPLLAGTVNTDLALAAVQGRRMLPTPPSRSACSSSSAGPGRLQGARRREGDSTGCPLSLPHAAALPAPDADSRPGQWGSASRPEHVRTGPPGVEPPAPAKVRTPGGAQGHTSS